MKLKVKVRVGFVGVLFLGIAAIAVVLIFATNRGTPPPATTALPPTPPPPVTQPEKPTAPPGPPLSPVSPPITPPVPQSTTPAPATPAPGIEPAPPPSPVAKPDPQLGEKTFYAVGCIGCHTVQGVGGRVGPELTDIAQRRDAAYIRESQINPKAYIVPGHPPVMPSAAELGLSDQDVENIIAWFQSLK